MAVFNAERDFPCATQPPYIGATANIYSHLDDMTKADTGAAMSKALG